MPHDPTSPPVVLAVGGHDPTGGAGIQADIETLAALGCHAATALTCLTVQDTRDVARIVPVEPGVLAEQVAVVRADLPPVMLKIGLIGDPGIAAWLLEIVPGFAGRVVLDPVLAAGGGRELADGDLAAAVARLLPHVGLTTPNRAEARRLTGQTNPDTAARVLLERGCGAVLLTGADEATDLEVVNRLYLPGAEPRDFRWPRLSGVYHGSGCTLASACAARLAHGDSLEQAVEAAQQFTWNALGRAHAPGHGQFIPRRIRA
jgi:hydroxymethylpyrimidine/phosphomethylpyrimidine kinase